MRPLLRFKDLQALKIVPNRPTLQRWIEKQGFPPGTLLGPNYRTWTPEEIEEYQARRRAMNPKHRLAKQEPEPAQPAVE